MGVVPRPVLAASVSLAGLATWATVAVLSSEWVADANGAEHVSAAIVLAVAWLVPVCGVVVWRWRPWTRAGQAILLLAACWSAWAALGQASGFAAWCAAVLTTAFRPITFWLVLAWPMG